MPGLLEALRRNESVGTLNAKLFEIGSAFWIDDKSASQERRRVTWVGGNFREVRGACEALLARLDPNKTVHVTPSSQTGFGSAGEVKWGGRVIGSMGSVDRAIITAIGLREAPAAAELDLQELIDGARQEMTLKPLPRFPAVSRDISLIVPDATAYADIAATFESCKLPDLEALDYVTTYRGKPLASGTKSVTLKLVFRSPSETLTADRVDCSVAAAIGAAGQKARCDACEFSSGYKALPIGVCHGT